MAGYLLEAGDHKLLLDIGAGSLRRLLEARCDLYAIEAICITHFHIDHIADLVPYLWAVRFSPEYTRDRPLFIFGPPGLLAWYNNLAVAHGNWMLELPFALQLQEVADESFTWRELEITTRTMHHSVPANGYRLQYGSKTLTYSGDTGYCENVIELGHDVDLLLIECAFPDGWSDVDTHLTPAGVGKIAAACQPKKVVLTHMYPICERYDLLKGCAEHFQGPVELARDLVRFTV